MEALSAFLLVSRRQLRYTGLTLTAPLHNALSIVLLLQGRTTKNVICLHTSESFRGNLATVDKPQVRCLVPLLIHKGLLGLPDTILETPAPLSCLTAPIVRSIALLYVCSQTKRLPRLPVGEEQLLAGI